MKKIQLGYSQIPSLRGFGHIGAIFFSHREEIIQPSSKAHYGALEEIFKGLAVKIKPTDKGLWQLTKLMTLSLALMGGMGIIFGSLTLFLVPYYQSKQALNQQISLENELQKLPQQETERWKQFQLLIPSFHFTNIKMKTAFYSLCRVYGVTLKTGQIHDLTTEEGVSFKPGNLTITAMSDEQIFAFLQHLSNKLTGVLGIKMVKLHRSRDLDDMLLSQIKSGQGGHLVEAVIEFEWLIFNYPGRD
ncbi:hypothetical protein [Candidatus Paracaedibacter symbiosus]|uniref:hypothetical protein n=1 Tax=Candidatus Paracaedibacter symbiosus TaxID=244582 RepID=UPI00050955FB|nr:hypothetical protein [Candidatus Paracaedibacter symbiosus]